MKNKLILLLAVIFGLLAAYGAYQYLESVKESYRLSGNFAQVAVAKQRIPAKAPITDQMIEFKEMPVEYIMPGAVVDINDAVGKLARSEFYPGEQLFTNKLIGPNDPAGGLSTMVEEGKRAVTIPVSNVSALHGLLGIGDYVDMMVTFSTDTDTKYTATSTIIQNVPVLAVNRRTEGTSGTNEDPQTVTVMVAPEQGQQIALAIQQGSVQLMLRAPEDSSSPGMSSTRVENLLR